MNSLGNNLKPVLMIPQRMVHSRDLDRPWPYPPESRYQGSIVVAMGSLRCPAGRHLVTVSEEPQRQDNRFGWAPEDIQYSN